MFGRGKARLFELFRRGLDTRRLKNAQSIAQDAPTRRSPRVFSKLAHRQYEDDAPRAPVKVSTAARWIGSERTSQSVHFRMTDRRRSFHRAMAVGGSRQWRVVSAPGRRSGRGFVAGRSSVPWTWWIHPPWRTQADDNGRRHRWSTDGGSDGRGRSMARDAGKILVTGPDLLPPGPSSGGDGWCVSNGSGD